MSHGKVDPDYFDKFDATDIEEFHDTWLGQFGQPERWETATDEQKLSFAVEIIDAVLTMDSRPVVNQAWRIVYAATEHIYPPIPIG